MHKNMRNLAGNFALLLRGQNCARNSKISEVEVYSIMISTFMQLNDNDIRVSISSLLLNWANRLAGGRVDGPSDGNG